MNSSCEEEILYKWQFKNKYYPHFDTESPLDAVEKIINDIETQGQFSHPFYPLIRYKQTKRRRDENGRVYIDINSPRYITHTARIDSNIYSYYRTVLMNKYEKILKHFGISECVIAYRKIPILPNHPKGKSNVHFASEAIEEIKKQIKEKSSCLAIAMDITGFFDHLDHTIIKNNWCCIMGFDNGLPKDHYNIYKNITKYTYIDSDILESTLDIKLHKIHSKRICNNQVFKEKIKPLLSKKNKNGIPQGSPISDVIANMYMLDFDILMKRMADKYQGYYRRYSDDILFICHPTYKSKILRLIPRLIKYICKTLAINEKKTTISFFDYNEQKVECKSYKVDNKKIKETPTSNSFEYLGLSFDGIKTQIRQPTISNFYSKLSKKIKKEVKIAYLKLFKNGILYPSANKIYNMINFKYIYNYAKKIKLKKNTVAIGKTGNFYTYVKLVCQITGNSELDNFFKPINRYVKNKAKNYCEKLV